MTNQQQIKSSSLAKAIDSGVGIAFDDMGRQIVNADKIIEAAKKFENYLNGEANHENVPA